MTQQLFSRVTTHLFSIISAVALVVIAAAAAGCSESARRAANPVAPSHIAPDAGLSSAAPSGAHSTTPDVSRGFHDDEDSEDSEDSDSDDRKRDRNREVDVDGVVGVVNGVCPNLTFTVAGRTVKVSRNTTFRGGSCNDLLAGVRVKVTGRRAADGSIEATRIEFDNRQATVEVEGEVRTVTGSCPSVTVTIGDRVVKTTRDTAFRRGNCADLRAGARVEITGRRATDGSIEATRIEFDSRTVEVEGVIRTVTGACPSVTMTVDNRTVKTTRDTTFRSGNCADLRPGARVEITGRPAADGSIEANRVEIERKASAEVELSGVITITSSGCPAGSFTLKVGSESVVIRTAATTRFRNGQCTNLRTAGRRLEVKGRWATDGAIDATRIEFRR